MIGWRSAVLNNGCISSHDEPPYIGVSSRPPEARDINRRFLSRFHKLAMERKRQQQEYVANHQKAVKLIAEAFDGELSRERVQFGSSINDSH